MTSNVVWRSRYNYFLFNSQATPIFAHSFSILFDDLYPDSLTWNLHNANFILLYSSWILYHGSLSSCPHTVRPPNLSSNRYRTVPNHTVIFRTRSEPYCTHTEPNRTVPVPNSIVLNRTLPNCAVLKPYSKPYSNRTIFRAQTVPFSVLKPYYFPDSNRY